MQAPSQPQDDEEVVTAAEVLGKLPSVATTLQDPSASASSTTSHSPSSTHNVGLANNPAINDQDPGRRKIVSCLDCHYRKVKVSAVCELVITLSAFAFAFSAQRNLTLYYSAVL